ncbi:MAG: tetratricopeptide repeat protein [Candidatus Daviesbacteria bacterium]|nr:tetratricopeptide repeat protein [Candidatus Daviesbacteria bacterium]
MDATSQVPSTLNHKAIDAALDCKWEEALRINKQIIKLDPQNIDALNRQAKAYTELGKLNLAKKVYSEVLKVDPYNPIAQKNLKILRSFKSSGKPHITNGDMRLSPALFLQEPGKTKIVSLLKVAEPQKLSQIYCGMAVEMIVKNRKLTVADHEGNYLGVLPDDICHHLLRLLRGGNKYTLYIKSIRVNGLSVLIREIFRSKRFKNQASFLEGSSRIHSNEILTAFDNEEDNQIDEESEES